MNPQIDLDRQLSLWLADRDPGPLPAAVSRAALAEARTRPFRRWWGPFRMPSWPRHTGGMVIIVAAGLLAALAAGLATAGQRPSPNLADRGVFTQTGSLSTQRAFATATTLLDGRVLVLGGYTGSIGGETLDTAEIWDPASGEFSSAGHMTRPRDGHSAVLLRDGRVLIVGGMGDDGIASAEIWDPVDGSFRATGSLAHGRAPRYHGRLALLPDDRVMVVGGERADGSLVEPPEIWDPASETWSAPEPSLATRRPPGVDLADGRVLIVDGDGARIWDPTTETTVPTGSPAVPRAVAGTVDIGVLLADGRVLVGGGYPADGGSPLATAEIWDPADGRFSPTGPMAHGRAWAATSRLADGRVLVVGGKADASAELFNPDGNGPEPSSAQHAGPTTG